MFATPYLPARIPGARHPGTPATPRQCPGGDPGGPDVVTLTAARPDEAPPPGEPPAGAPPARTAPPVPPERDPGHGGRDPASPRQRLQNDTKSPSEPGTPSPVVSRT